MTLESLEHLSMLASFNYIFRLAVAEFQVHISCFLSCCRIARHVELIVGRLCKQHPGYFVSECQA